MWRSVSSLKRLEYLPPSRYCTCRKFDITSACRNTCDYFSQRRQCPSVYSPRSGELLIVEPPVFNAKTFLNCIRRSYFSHYHLKQNLTKYVVHAFHTSSCQTADLDESKLFITDYSKLGTAKCRKCGEKIAKNELRIGKLAKNPYSSSEDLIKMWYHPNCLFDIFKKARVTTRKIHHSDDIDGFENLDDEGQKTINELINEFYGPVKLTHSSESGNDSTSTSSQSDQDSKATVGSGFVIDTPFSDYVNLCEKITKTQGNIAKSNVIKEFLFADDFRGDHYLMLKLLLPKDVKRTYKLGDKTLTKHFSKIFDQNYPKMVKHLEKGDIAETVRKNFEKNTKVVPQKVSSLTIQEVDTYLEELTGMTKLDEQQQILTEVAERCTEVDLMWIVRIMKHNLKLRAGAKAVLDGLHHNAYEAFQASQNLHDVVQRALHGSPGDDGKRSKGLEVRAMLMTPVKPMLADNCDSIAVALKKFPKGFYAETKYDGERVQIHKKRDEFQYFSRSLKPVMPHKVQHFKDYITSAIPEGEELILDGEVLLIDRDTAKPLPFGSLGVHKKEEFQHANVCLFVFDCLHVNGVNLMNKPLKLRRQFLEENMTQIDNRIMFSKVDLINTGEELSDLMTATFQQGLEGLVLKDIEGIYEPGKRRWLKVKKENIDKGSMADSADLTVLGAYYGTGNKGGIMSVFLMGVHDPKTEQWYTVTKCGNGLDDKTLEQINSQLDVVKISRDIYQAPEWLNVRNPLVPDFVVADPKAAPVWEIIGAEFSKSEVHSAAGISIRFPRIKRFREDKTWKEATDITRLQELFDKSKQTT